MSSALLNGRRLVILPVLLAGLGLWAWSAVDNAWNYTEVVATVDAVEEVCVPVGQPTATATSARCAEAEASPSGKWWHLHAVHVVYPSPTDGQQHRGVVIANGGDAAVDASKLRSGDRWTILARNDDPLQIKAR